MDGCLTGLSRNKLEVKVSCQRLTASLCLRASSLLTLPSPRLQGRSHWNLFFILTFLNRYIWLGGSSPVSTCASGCKWISVLVPGALLHSPGAAKTSWSLDTAAVPFLCRAKMSRFKSDLFGCSRLHDYMAVIDGMKRWRRRWEAREADFFRFHSSPTECRGA